MSKEQILKDCNVANECQLSIEEITQAFPDGIKDLYEFLMENSHLEFSLPLLEFRLKKDHPN